MPKVTQLDVELLGLEPRRSDSSVLLIVVGPRMRGNWRGGSILLLLSGTRAPIPTLCSPWTETGNYTCEFCGKQYKYYTPYQEHVALHAPISEYLLWLGGWGVVAEGWVGPKMEALPGEGDHEGDLGPGAISRCLGLTLGHLTVVAGIAGKAESLSHPRSAHGGHRSSTSFSGPVLTSEPL